MAPTLTPLVHIADVKGEQFLTTDTKYGEANDAYFSKYGSLHDSPLHPLKPGLIVKPSSRSYTDAINDIVLVLNKAIDEGRKVAVRTGGHQYSGASSTGPSNIVLDLRDTFLDKDKDFLPAEDKDTKEKRLRVSVSWDLGTFNSMMAAKGWFVPHGQCQGVHLGGHVQSGGYGQLGRSFGLFADYVVALEVVDPDNAPNYIKEVTRKSDPDLFYALLGGSPGNFGVITHITIAPQDDNNHKGSHGLKAIHFYDYNKMKKFLDLMVDWSDKDIKGRNWDLCISIVSQSGKPFASNPHLNEWIRTV